MLVHYQSHLIATEIFPEDTDAFRFNPITMKYHISFVNHPDKIALINSIGDMNTIPLANTGLSDRFKDDCSSADSFKNSIKRHASLFTTFKEVKNWDAWHRNTLATDRAQDRAEVLNPDCCPLTEDDANIFIEK